MMDGQGQHSLVDGRANTVSIHILFQGSVFALQFMVYVDYPFKVLIN